MMFFSLSESDACRVNAKIDTVGPGKLMDLLAMDGNP